jgi:peptidoglycan/xylan/chitin deacetylase (PgdA/CDA1 family)
MTRRRHRHSAARRIGAIVGLCSVVGALAWGAVTVAGRTSPVARTEPSAHRHARHRSAGLRPAPAVHSIDSGGLAALASSGRPVYCAAPRGHEVALTFDDGPGPYTPHAVHILYSHHARATFFVVGKSLAAYPNLLAVDQRVGTIGDHTQTHAYLPPLAFGAVMSQVAPVANLLTARLHQPTRLFRPPYGATSSTVSAVARQLGLVQVLWSVDSADSLGASWTDIGANLDAGLVPGAIVLMHENRGQTIRALEHLVFPVLARKGLRPVTVQQLLADDPPTPQQLAQGPRGCHIVQPTIEHPTVSSLPT